MPIDPPDLGRPPKWAQVLVSAANARNRARGSQEEFGLKNLAAIWEACGGQCAVSGLPFSLQICGDGQAKRPFAPSLDRIDRHKPYMQDNVRLVVSIANFAMNAWGADPLLMLASAVHRKHGDRPLSAESAPSDSDLDSMATIDTELVETTGGTVAFPPRPDLHRPILDLLRDGPQSSRCIENALADRFGVTMSMRSATLRSGCPAWRNQVAWALVDLVKHARGTGEIERIASKRAPNGGSMGIYQLMLGLTALHAPLPTAALPEGYQAKVRSIPLNVLGRAAALSDGQVADGRLDLSEFAIPDHKKVVLAQHLAFRLVTPTLEPVARPGDILLVKEPGEPTPRSLVIALSDDRILARRFEIADNHSDVAVLTAQSINPRQIAPPVIAHKATFKLHKIIGVLYDDGGWKTPTASNMEVVECGGEAVLNRLVADAFGLVEVSGQSAEPRALHGQYLIIRKEIAVTDALKTLVGKPIIAADSQDNRYFKRLQVPVGEQVVLESLDSGGDYGPVVLSAPGKGSNCLERVWPVAGVIFELPA